VLLATVTPTVGMIVGEAVPEAVSAVGETVARTIAGVVGWTGHPSDLRRTRASGNDEGRPAAALWSMHRVTSDRVLSTRWRLEGDPEHPRFCLSH
jgi:hypothetical protein